jgi:hypothetical protein
MNSSTHMNYLALNQNILNKGLVIGSGPQEGNSKIPITTAEGLQVFLNGTHVIPEHGELIKWYEIGSMIHPYAMSGMPGSSGEISYEFWVTEMEYIIMVRLKLDESTCGKSEPAADILALVKRDSLPKNLKDTLESYSIISREMLLCHFDSLFEFYNSIEELDEWTIDVDGTLYSFVQYHFELKNEPNSTSN